MDIVETLLNRRTEDNIADIEHVCDILLFFKHEAQNVLDEPDMIVRGARACGIIKVLADEIGGESWERLTKTEMEVNV